MSSVLREWLYSPPKKQFIAAELWHPRQAKVYTDPGSMASWEYDARLGKHVLHVVQMRPRCWVYTRVPGPLALSAVTFEYLVKPYSPYNNYYLNTLHGSYPGRKGYIIIELRTNLVYVYSGRYTDGKWVSLGGFSATVDEGEWHHILIVLDGLKRKTTICVDGACGTNDIGEEWLPVYNFWLLLLPGWYVVPTGCGGSFRRFRQEQYWAMARMWKTALSLDDSKWLWEHVQQIIS